MNRKGFTLVELIATLVVLGIVLGITIAGVNGVFDSAKGKTEDVFVGTIRDALDIYLTSKEAKDTLKNGALCRDTLQKRHNPTVKVYKATISFYDVIESEYTPITEADLVNPANEDVSCSAASNIIVNVYRDDDYVYYYSVDKSSFGCLLSEGVISNFPDEEFVC